MTKSLFPVLFLACTFVGGCAASTDPASGESADVGETDDALVAKPTPIQEMLFSTPNGLSGCKQAELVTSLTTEHVLLPTYPVGLHHVAKLASFYRACAGVPVPAVYIQGPTVSLERIAIGCGSYLYRGDLPEGGKLEIFDHRTARAGWGCGMPSTSPVIVRMSGKLSYALNRKVACNDLGTPQACDSREDCVTRWVSLQTYPPQHVSLCEKRPAPPAGPVPVADGPN